MTMPKTTFFHLSEEKRNRIINAAILQFSKTHYNKVTIDSIVQEAKIPKGSFYQYFSNKDDLYLYVFSRIGDDKMTILDNLMKDVINLSFKAYILRVLKQAEAFEIRDPYLSELKEKFIHQCPQNIRKEVLKNEIPKSYRILETVIKAYIEKGELRNDLDVKKSAYIITSITVQLEHYEFLEGDSINHIISDLIDILLRGMLKE